MKNFSRHFNNKDHKKNKNIIQLPNIPQKGSVYKVYEQKNKKTPYFVGVVVKSETKDKQIIIYFEVISSKELKRGKSICMSYVFGKNLWQILKERLAILYGQKKKKCHSQQLYKLLAA